MMETSISVQRVKMSRKTLVSTATHIDAALAIIEATALTHVGKRSRGAFENSVVDRFDPPWLFIAGKQPGVVSENGK